MSVESAFGHRDTVSSTSAAPNLQEPHELQGTSYVSPVSPVMDRWPLHSKLVMFVQLGLTRMLSAAVQLQGTLWILL